jgi:hypothetical protein
MLVGKMVEFRGRVIRIAPNITPSVCPVLGFEFAE